MKLKGLKALTDKVVKMQDLVNEKIEALDQDGRQWEEKDDFYNDAWMELDAAKEALERVAEMKLEAYL